MYLVLDQAQADALRGPTSPGAELQPIALADGERWVLPTEVLDDPAHEPRRAGLLVLPIEEVAPEEFPQPELALPAGG